MQLPGYGNWPLPGQTNGGGVVVVVVGIVVVVADIVEVATVETKILNIMFPLM